VTELTKTVEETDKTAAKNDKTVVETVAGNVRAYRHLRSLSQADLARRMYSLGMFPWSRVTVSEVERGQRNVTVAELLALAFVLDTTIEQLLDTRGPERIRGPHMALYDKPEGPTERTPFHVPLPAEAVLALVCTHDSAQRPVAEWDDNWLSHVHLVDREPR
jgi:transcriptional regulator with XRE-family HTH domain